MTTAAGHVPTLRLFTALWPPPALRSALAALRDRWQWPPGAALVDAARLHVTLHFIGQVPAMRLPELATGLAADIEPVEMDFDAARQQVWPGGIAVLAFDAPEPLQRLHARLAQALSALGLRVEARPWRPHVTFARKAQGAVPPRDGGALPRWRVDRYALVRSVPGAGYQTLLDYPQGQG